jgi:acyl carrier protein
MGMNDIITTANGFLVDEFEVDESKISPGANFHQVLDLDSLDYVDLVVIVDDNFGFKMTSEDFKQITTFADFYNFIETRISVKG